MLHSFLILNYLFIFLCCLWAPMNDWVPRACCDMISGGIKYIAGICFPPLSGSDDAADKYSSPKVEEPRQQNKYVLCSIILIASSSLVGVEWGKRRLLLSDTDCYVFMCPVWILQMKPVALHNSTDSASNSIYITAHAFECMLLYYYFNINVTFWCFISDILKAIKATIHTIFVKILFSQYMYILIYY